MAPPVTALWVAMSTLGGVLILGEAATWGLLLGGLLVIAGTYFVVAGRIEGLPDPTAPARPGPLATLAMMTVVAGSWAASTLLIAGGRGPLDAIAVSALRVPFGGLLIALVYRLATIATALVGVGFYVAFRKEVSAVMHEAEAQSAEGSGQ